MTLKEATLEYLKIKPLTSKEAFNELGVTRLSAIIFNLKKDGYNIIKRQVDGVNRYGRAVYFAEYTLVGEKKDEQV